MRHLLAFFLAVIICIALHCTHVAGTASEVDGKYAVVGQVVENSGNPVIGAIVRIRPTGYLALNGSKSFAFDTITDKNGFFFFDTLPVDSYTIEINQNGKLGALRPLTICTYDSFPVVLPVTTVSPTGSIIGGINLPISDDTSRPWVALYNVDYLVKAPITQEFKFEGLPQGFYNLRIVPFLESKLVLEMHDVQVTGNSQTDVGTLNFTIQQFFKGCASYECDSMAIRSILDANGLNGISVHSVVTVDTVSGRVVGLNLSSSSIVTVPKDIGSLSRLNTLDLRGNKIVSLPEQSGYLKAMKNCYLDSNELYALPLEFAYLCSLSVLTVSHNHLYCIDNRLMSLPVTKLDLRFNQLEAFAEESRFFPEVRFLYLDNNKFNSLPRVLMQLKLQEFSISNNRLCSMTSSFSKWLSTFDQAWDASQNCTDSTTSE
jgi:hypothetical protein